MRPRERKVEKRRGCFGTWQVGQRSTVSGQRSAVWSRVVEPEGGAEGGRRKSRGVSGQNGTRKHDIHVSICRSEGFTESRNRGEKGKLIVKKRARGFYGTMRCRQELYTRRWRRKRKRCTLDVDESDRRTSTNEKAALGFFWLASSQH
jgi:hypothetical protein